ncbi:hypothetical protein SDRG_15897 [Saprolegnia diclina VS20]|uniref:Secreted protein n=1 Tax=Saprolegnia diclina (strain VS20) TaxID=1156394 RepID=T0PYZ5_SAPDV|nr:hypothetical protein SDRG_15897 [Saprolegnia diclina VS20]EQC26310.1 hypothetical protein SDRG_15897 [Saprolegnia diclina VS20]|eukprot:XP_008620305.1 hypothetical protein SDRG_15897 [Saprolegnia diclina VS20]
MKTFAILASLAVAASATVPDCTVENLAGVSALLANATGPLPPCAKSLNIDVAKIDPSWQPADMATLEAFMKSSECKTYFNELAGVLKKINPPCNLAKGAELTTATFGAMTFDDFTAGINKVLAAAKTTTAPTTKPSSAATVTGATALALTAAAVAMM